MIARYGRLLGLNERRTRSMENWFSHHGSLAVFLSQLLPIFRDLIPFPAGLAEMKVGRFALFSILGSIPFCLMLALVGFLSGPAWEPAIQSLDRYDIFVFAAADGATLLYFVYTRMARA